MMPSAFIITSSELIPRNRFLNCSFDIGTVTSDSGGLFKKMWTPSSEGEYTVYATFDGSNSYYGSYAETALGITKATETPSTPTVEVPDYTMTIIGVGIAIIVVVVIAVAVAVLLLRKR